MTRQQFVDAFFHEYFGMIADGALQARGGAELSLWLRTMQARALAQLGRMWDQLSRGAQSGAPAANPKENTKEPTREQRTERK